jgi:hypothetical protein
MLAWRGERMMERAVLERFENGHAVIVLESKRILAVERSVLPGDVREGDILRVAFTDGVVTYTEVDVAATAALRKRIEENLERLRLERPIRRSDDNGSVSR